MTDGSTSFAAAMKANYQKLTLTRKESEEDDDMASMDLREVQSADSGFLVRIERSFIFEDKVLMICWDKILDRAKHVVQAIVPTLVDH